MKRFVALSVFVFLCSFALTNAFAQADLGLKGVGAEVGMVNPEDLDATVGFGLFVDLGNITPQFMLEGYFDFWTTSENTAFAKASARDIALGAKGKWVFRTSNPRIRPFAGGGLGIHFLHAEVTTPDQYIGGILVVPAMTFQDDSVKLGLDLGGGMNVTLNEKTDFIGELWYGLVSDVNQLSLKVGVLYKLGQ
jgi:hypothetical protein